jgi:hypothetical protein
MPNGFLPKSKLNELRSSHGLASATFTMREKVIETWYRASASVTDGYESKSKWCYTKKEAEHDAARVEYERIKTSGFPPNFSRDCIRDKEVDYRLDEYEIHVTDKDDGDSEHENIITLLEAMKEGKFIGLDCEWSQHPQHDKRLTLIQVASETVCVLLRCGHEHPMAEKVKASITTLLEAENVIKYGVGLENDVAKLLECEEIDVKNTHSIASMDTYAAIYGCKISPGMTHLITHWLGEKAAYKVKDTGMGFSDNVDPLSIDMIKYAALDAIVSYALGKKIHEEEDLSNSFMYAYSSSGEGGHSI